MSRGVPDRNESDAAGSESVTASSAWISAQAEQRQDRENDDHEADEVDDAVHDETP
jgi:hypothetical protein